MQKKYNVKIFSIGTIVSLICLSFISNISAELIVIKENDEITKEGFNHLLCFVEAGYVRHEIVNISGFYLSYPFAFCIGSITLNLTAFHQQTEETRLKIKGIGQTIHYGCNVSVLLKGFIGKIQSTGSISGGFLRGFTIFAQVSEI